MRKNGGRTREEEEQARDVTGQTRVTDPSTRLSIIFSKGDESFLFGDTQVSGVRPDFLAGRATNREGRATTFPPSCAKRVLRKSRGAMKRQHAAVVESALANVDVVSHLGSFLAARDLCQVKATCRALGSANDGAGGGLSMAEEAARRAYEGATDEEKAKLPRYIDEGWIELYHHLLMLRGRLTFNQLVGDYVEYLGGDEAAVQGVDNERGTCQAICGNHT